MASPDGLGQPLARRRKVKARRSDPECEWEEVLSEATKQEALDDELVCVVCLEIKREVQECRNEHVVCGACVAMLSSCPLACGSTEFKASRKTNRRVGRLPCTCPARCGWRGTLEQVDKHYISDCPLLCHLCKQHVPQCNKEAHMRSCPKLPVECMWCGTTKAQARMQRHVYAQHIEEIMRVKQRREKKKRKDSAEYVLGCIISLVLVLSTLRLCSVQVQMQQREEMWISDILLNLNQHKWAQYAVLRGADVSQVDHKGNNILHVAAFSNWTDLVNTTLRLHGGDTKLVHAKNEHADTPLDIAFMLGHEQIVEMLLLHGALGGIDDENIFDLLFFASADGEVQQATESLLQRIRLRASDPDAVDDVWEALQNDDDDAYEMWLMEFGC